MQTVERSFEERLAFDRTEPCADCPFLKATPAEKKGISSLGEIGLVLLTHGEIVHTCHKTDPRVTDGGFNSSYQGPVEHCAGFMLMVKKSGMYTGPMIRAVGNGKLAWQKLKSLEKVHDLRELCRIIVEWAKS
jgi:hypothetical protein